jgi:hypothetical protein
MSEVAVHSRDNQRIIIAALRDRLACESLQWKCAESPA